MIWWWLWVIHGYTILPLYNPFTKKRGTVIFLSLLMVGFIAPLAPVAPFSTKGLEEDDARCSVRWMLDACERRFAPGTWHETFMAWVQRRARREPVQYIVGSADECGDELTLGILGESWGWGWDVSPTMDLSLLTGLLIFQAYPYIWAYTGELWVLWDLEPTACHFGAPEHWVYPHPQNGHIIFVLEQEHVLNHWTNPYK